MPLQDKIDKVASILPPNQDIFVTYAQFETVQQVPTAIRNKYFIQNLQDIAKMIVQGIYTDKQPDQIQEIDLITDLQDWLSTSGVKFSLQKNNQTKNPKIEKIEKKPETITPRQQQTPPIRNISPQINLSPKPQRKQPQPTYQSFSSIPNQASVPSQPRPQAYYHNILPPQSKAITVKNTKQKQFDQISQQTTNTVSNDPQLLKRQHIQKQNFGWLDNISKCLTYPERRYYICSQMHPKRKF